MNDAEVRYLAEALARRARLSPATWAEVPWCEDDAELDRLASTALQELAEARDVVALTGRVEWPSEKVPQRLRRLMDEVWALDEKLKRVSFAPGMLRWSARPTLNDNGYVIFAERGERGTPTYRGFTQFLTQEQVEDDWLPDVVSRIERLDARARGREQSR